MSRRRPLRAARQLAGVAALLALAGRVATAQAGSARARAAAAGAAARTVVRAARLAAPAPVIDGHDDDEAWRGVAPISEFLQFTPVEDGAPSFRTEVRVLFDARNLYVVARAFDPHPDSILPLLSRRDVRTNSDQMKVLIDGYRDRRNALQFMLNPAGVKRDASIYNDTVEDMSWDGVWDGAAAIDSLGWVAEYRIPLSQLRFNGSAPTFGFGIWRDVARRNERDAWPAFRQSRQTLVSQLGALEGLEGLEPGSPVELLPYAVTKNVTRPTAGGWEHPQELTGGLDVKWRVTPNLTLDATVNPDFGQVEVDPAVLNLSAFEVRFEERRPFFQEGVGLFKCGGPCEGLLYTRRIGRTPQLRASALDPAGTAILGATKLTGRLRSGLSVGLIEAVTRREEGVSGRTIEPQTSYFVGRAVQELRQGRSQVGVMVTAVNRDLDDATAPFLRRAAYNGLLQGSHRFARDRWEVMGYTGVNRVAGSREAIALTQRSSVHYFQRPDGDVRFDSLRTTLGGHVVAGSLSKIAGAVRASTYVRYATPGLELNDLGFVPVVNDVSVTQTVSYQALKPARFYRRMFNFVSAERHWTTGGLAAASKVTGHLSWELRNYWGASVTASVNDVGGTHCIPCARGGPAVRQQPKHDLSLSLSGDPRRAVTPRGIVAVGMGEGGNSYGYALVGGADLRIASRVSASVDANYTHRNDDQQWIANLRGGDGALRHTFAHLRQEIVTVTGRVNVTASPTLSLQLYTQPFVTTGRFTDWRAVAQPRAPRYADRWVPFGDGRDPDGFRVAQFNTNAVARWEYRPGSTLFVVWQQGRARADAMAVAFDPVRDYRDLFRAHPDNTLLVKVAWWVNP